MKILFTGASSFTGMWFIKELAEAGHKVTAIFPRPLENYQGLRRERVDHVLEHCKPVFHCTFGSQTFLNLIDTESEWDLLCHHAADVTDYKSPDFNFANALANNTKNIEKIILHLKDKGCQRILLTGSVFEQNEGKGTDNLRAVSPYGLSKGLTSDVFQFFTSTLGIKLGKFVIPNPFGPYEEPRFTSYIVRSWFEGKTPEVSFPDYVRDNIHVSLLAKAYLAFAHQLTDDEAFKKLNPSGYCESQGDFTRRFSQEMEKRLPISCPFDLVQQTRFSEPRVRINTGAVCHEDLGWNEKEAWDKLAEYYQAKYGKL